ncbi:MAG: alpha-ketoacid dehydrogenase subunit beta [Treponema sp.]|jgi:pyruvate dehydrogenase E1 component beta subunit|nr:alpha-ketoacid dehydrogenase subunit beta [Treponema sp.]
MSVKTYAAAIRDVMAQEMRRDGEIFLMGEDVGRQGGIFGCSKGLLEEFGERVRDTPISENTIVGAGVGAASVGMRPIVELMYMDFLYLAMDQILNQAAKIRYMFGGKVKIPMVIRGQQGIGRGNGAQHSQSLESMMMNIPGIKVVCPSTPSDAAGLLRTAIRDDNPVLFIEHKALYSTRGEVSDDPEWNIPFAKADVFQTGSDLTIVANYLYRQKSLEAAAILAKEGISAELIDPRTMVPLDTKTIVESVKKTGRLVTVHEAHRTMGWGTEVAESVVEEAFPYLDAPPRRVGAKMCSLPFNLGLENAVVPQVADIVDAAKKALHL